MTSIFTSNNLVIDRRIYITQCLDQYINKVLVEIVNEYDHPFTTKNCIFLYLTEQLKIVKTQKIGSNQVLDNIMCDHVCVVMSPALKVQRCNKLNTLCSFGWDINGSHQAQIAESEQLCKCIMEKDNVLLLIQSSLAIKRLVVLQVYVYNFDYEKTGKISLPTQYEIIRGARGKMNFEIDFCDSDFLWGRFFWFDPLKQLSNYCILSTEYLTKWVSKVQFTC